MWDGIIAFTHAGFAAGSGWCVMPFGFGSFCYVSEQLLFRTRAFSVLSQLPATQAAETVRTTGMENASSKRYCHPSRELFRAGDLLFFHLSCGKRTADPPLRCWNFYRKRHRGGA
jgi:hypothetical protein